MNKMDLAHSDYLQRAFTSLLGEFGHLWPKQDVDYVSDEVGHGEYGDALENLIAIGLRNSQGFGPSQLQQIEALAAAMGMTDAPLLTRLRSTAKDAALPR